MKLILCLFVSLLVCLQIGISTIATAEAIHKAPYMVIKDGKIKMFILTQHGAEMLEQRGYIVHLHNHGEKA